MENIIIIAVLILVVGSACLYIRKEKKKGKCIGCPASGCASCKCCHSTAELMPDPQDKR